MLIDSHCHLNFKAFEADWPSVLERSVQAGVGLIVVSTDLKTSQKALEIAQNQDRVWAAVGFHPIHVVDRDWRSEVNRILELVRHPKVVALGEIGFDRFDLKRRNIPTSDWPSLIATQSRIVDLFLAESKVSKKPIIFHSREAQDLISQTVTSHKANRSQKEWFVQHCFPGRLEDASQIIASGGLISFTGLITYNHQSDEVVKQLPLEKIMIETDSPYLTPEPFRGQRNEPGYVRAVADRIAQLKGLTFQEVARTTTGNAERFFGV